MSTKKTNTDAILHFCEAQRPQTPKVSQDYLETYSKKLDARLTKLCFIRQETGILHNSPEWGDTLYAYVKSGDIDGLTRFYYMERNWIPGMPTNDPLRDGKNNLRNLSAEQRENGVVPIVVPHSRNYDTLIRNHSKAFGEEKLTGVAGWGDAAVIVPWEMYRMTGNALVLQQQFDSMKAWCDYILRTARDERGGYPEEYDRWLWNTGFHFGEWHIPSEEYKPDHSHCKNTARYTAPLFGYRSISLFAKVCEVLNKKEAACYKQAAERMKQAIGKTLMADGRMPVDFMGAYVLALAFDAVPEHYRQAFAERLAQMVEEKGCKLDTGFLATPYLLDVLVQIGREDLAEAVFWQSDEPSWLYQVDMGATAMWESWFNLRPGKDPGITSFNHYAFGCVDRFILSHICGITAEEPGFRKIRIEPHPGRLRYLKRSLRCPYGEIIMEIREGELSVTIPCNTTATVAWGDAVHQIGSGKYAFLL